VSIQVTINNIPFNIPVSGEQPEWGESLTNYLVEIAAVLNSLKGPNDVLETGVSIALNQTTFADIFDFSFNSVAVRSFSVEGVITRTTDTTKLYEEFTLRGLNTDGEWVLQQEGIGYSGVIFDITTAGQVQYKSVSISGTGYSGVIKFRGIALSI
jgi:hypothetical protein